MFRFTIQCTVTLAVLLSTLCACAEPGRAVRTQEIAVTLVPEAHLVLGESRLSYESGAGAVTLYLSPSATIDTVTVSNAKATYTFHNGTVSIRIPGHAEANPAVRIVYRARFNDAVSTHPGSSEDPTYGVNAAITARGTFLGSGSGWYPVPASVPSRRITTITAPAGIEGITSGSRVARQTGGQRWSSVWEEAHPVGELSLSAGSYRVEESRVDGIPLYAYLYPENASLARRYLDAAAKYLRFYVDLLGPYPFEKFAVVENFFPTGYGLPSYTLLGSSVIRLPFIVDTSFPHEIAHSWWGNGVDVEFSKGNWSEGLVTYLADYLLKERRSTSEAVDYRRQIIADFSTLVTPERDFPLVKFTSRSDPASRAIGYGKGAMLFHMIRRKIGDDAFWQGLRQLSREKMYRSASWDDFAAAFSRSSGQDLVPFMNQWLSRVGGPHLSLAGVSRKRSEAGWTVLGEVIQSSPTYDLLLPLALDGAAPAPSQVVPIAAKRSRFALEAGTAPRRLLLDPGAELFRVLAADEIPATVNRIKGSKGVVGVVTRSCRADAATFRNVLASLDQPDATVVPENEASEKNLRGHDLLFCGVPEHPGFRTPLPAGIALSPEGFSVEEERWATSDAALFLVLPHPVSPELVAGVFLPLSETAAAQYGYKITHYGKYGFLVFAGGTNRVKGIPPPSTGASVVNLQ